jgi:hypothetical protein
LVVSKTSQTYMLPYDPKWPVVCFDEASKQLFGEVRPPVSTTNTNGKGSAANS